MEEGRSERPISEDIEIMPKECDGCLTYHPILFERFCSLYPYNSNRDKCPCMECIVKVTCKDVCDSLTKYKLTDGAQYDDS